MEAKNPVLHGFFPDPSLLRVGEDYYIANSTFEWFPGVAISHSRDLVNWELVSYALTDDARLDMTGLDSSCGVWAPNLTYADGLFYLVYTIVYTDRPRYKDTFNFLVTAPDVRGPWSEPVPLNRSGFDPSLFHDDDGKKYLVNMVIDHRDGQPRFAGINVQEYDPAQKRLIGEPVRVYRGTKIGATEGPNILKEDGFYYLTCAEGGTGWRHCVTMARAKDIFGPYEESPYNPILTSNGNGDCRLKRAGHGQIIQTAEGEWVMAHLCSRPVDDCSILGRETAIQNLKKTGDGWFVLDAEEEKQAVPSDTFTVPAKVKQQMDHSEYIDFSDGVIPLSCMTLRQSAEHCGISVQEGKLHIEGGASPFSKFKQGLLARRQQALNCDFKTRMTFRPAHLNHIAGMLVFYNCDNHYYLKMMREEEGLTLSVSSVVNRDLKDVGKVLLPEGTEHVCLKAEIRTRDLQFFYAVQQGEWEKIGPVLDMRNISDERIVGNGFTGSMLAVNCCDCEGDGTFSEFDYLDYREYEPF